MKTYLVGGAVRDELLGKEVSDKDYVVVGSTRQEMRDRGFESVGISFPVFLHPETGDEYALARTERKVGNGYNGFEVSTTDVTIEDDLFRRDLTVNAIAKDTETGELVDPYGGVEDLKNEVLRHVSDAFMEDPLRVVRLARFYSRYTTFTIHPDTVEMAKGVVSSGEMDEITYERYWAEMTKVMQLHMGDPARFFSALRLFGAFEKVKFFKEMFSPATNDWMGDVARMARDRFAPDRSSSSDGLYDPVVVMVALLSRRSPNLDKAPSKVVEVQDAMVRLDSLHDCQSNKPEALVKFFKQCKAVGRMSDTLNFTVGAMSVFEDLVGYCPFPMASHDLLAAAQACHRVTSDEFVAAGFKNEQIGLEMDKRRAERVAPWVRW